MRETTSVLSGEARHRSQDQIKQTLSCLIREKNISLDSYPELVVASGPLFYWRFGETSGVTAADASGFARDGTITAVTYSIDSLLAGAPENTAFLFNGATSNVSIANAAWMNVANITVAAWIRTTHAGFNQEILNREPGSTGWQFRLETNGALALHFWTGASYVSYISTALVNDGLPHHVVVTYNGAHVVIYVDSIRVLKTAATHTFPSPATGLLCGLDIGSTQEFAGTIDEISMWARALSSAEVREHYQSGTAQLAEIDYTRDRLRLYVKIRMNRNGDDGTPWASFPVGIYLLSAPDRDMVATGISRQVQGFDQTTILLQAAVTDRYVIASGLNYITSVVTLLQSAGLDTSGYQLTPTTLTLPSTRSWPLGTTKLKIVNDLLTSINYRLFRFNSAGVGIAEPDVLPKSRAIDYSYSTDEFSVMVADMRYTQNLFDVPNVVVLSNTQPKRNTITSTVVNNLLSSPTSVLRREGRKVYYVDPNFDAADQTTLDAAAANLLTRLSQPSEVWQFGTLAHPFHEDEDVLTLEDNTGRYSFGVSANFMELEWTLPFSNLAAGTMSHVAQRIVAVA